jgi:small multidrug resistance pump
VIHWVYLAIAILSEVVATASLRATDGFRNVWPSVAVVLGYGASFYFISLTLDVIPLGVAYAIWSGAGVALITLVGLIYYRQTLGPGELAGIGLIVAGVIVLKLYGKNVGG